MARRTAAVGLIAALCAACAGQPPASPQHATIYRDTWGVPHIEADTEEAGFYALGYAQAQDRLPQLLGSTLWVRGRLAEIMGDAMLPGDIETRRWLNFEKGTEGFARLSPQLQRDYRAFVAGAKKFMSENPKLVPPWAPELTPETLTALTRNMYWTGYNAVWGPAECSKEGVRRQLRSDVDRQSDVDRPSGRDVALKGDPRYPGEAPYPAAVQASNEWAVFPSRTADGETILLADPHVDVNNPFYYEYRMRAGDFFSAGFAAGAMLWQAQNRHVAWAFTTGHPDMWDCYAVETDPKDPRAYRFDGKPMQMEVRKETVKSASGKVVEQEFEYTRHNGVLSPVVRREGNVAYVVSQSQMDDGGLMDEEIYRMNRAGSVRELRDALKTLGMMAQNLMAVDDQGHGYYLHAGKTPKRPKGYDFTRPVPGNTSATAWQDFHPLDAMIEVMDPPQGYMQNNNSSPDVLFAEGNIDAAKYAPEVFYDTPGRITTRGARAREVLSKAQKFSVDDAKALALDEKWMTAKPWQDALRLALKKHPKRLDVKGAGRTLVESVLTFDGFAHAESSAALNFWFWRDEAGRLLEKPAFAGLKKFPWRESQLTPEFRRALLDAAVTAAQAQIKAVGSLDAPLGKYFRAAHGGNSFPLGGASILPVSGDDCLWQFGPQCDRTLRAFGFDAPTKAGERIAARGSQAPRLVVFGKQPQTWTLYAFGQQSTVGLPHADDQAALFSRRQMKPALLEHEELMKHVESKIELSIP